MKKIVHSVFGRDNFVRITLPILLVVVLAIIGWSSFRPANTNLSEDQAKTKAETFINNNLMQAGSKATIKDITEAYGLYKLNIDITTSVVESYMSKDGKLFFPQALDIDQLSGEQGSAAGSATAPAATVSTKNDKPVVELFVMSYCPYGTQIEKGILPVIKALGDKIDFQLKFVNYAMHGEKELQENLAQYCIQKEQNSKFQDYLNCFLASEDSASCLSSTGVNKSKLDSCVSITDKQYKITENFKNNVEFQGTYPSFNVEKADNVKYSVAGSPTLIINGEEISSNRDAASLLTTICSGFNNSPAECSTTLSSASPAPGFGTGTTASGTATAECQ